MAFKEFGDLGVSPFVPNQSTTNVKMFPRGEESLSAKEGTRQETRGLK